MANLEKNRRRDKVGNYQFYNLINSDYGFSYMQNQKQKKG